MSFKSTQFLFCAAPILALSLAATLARAEVRLAVPDIRVNGVDAGLGRMMTEILTTEASQIEGISVVGSSDIAAMLGFEKQKELLGCQDNIACVAEIGGALGVDYLLAGDLGLVGKTYVINLKLIDTRKVEVKKRLYKTVPDEPDALIETIKDSLPELLAAITKAAPPAKKEEPKAAPPAKKVEAKPAPVLDPAAAPATSGPRRWPAWTMVGVGGASFIMAGLFELSAANNHGDANETVGISSVNEGGVVLHSTEAAKQYQDARTLGKMALGAGLLGAALTGGGIWWLSRRRSQDAVVVLPTIDGDYTALTLLGCF